MKRALYVLAAVTVGVFVAIAASGALIAFIPNCGEDCASAALEIFAACMMSTLVLFGASALILSRHEIPSLRRSLGNGKRGQVLQSSICVIARPDPVVVCPFTCVRLPDKFLIEPDPIYATTFSRGSNDV